MKKLMPLVLLLIVIVSCDKIKKPDQRPPQVYHCIDTNFQVTNTLIGTKYRKVLVEDFTGHTCPNCPRAAEIAESLLNQNPLSVVVIANHVTGQYADPSRDSTNKLKEKFRNPVSDAWDDKVQGFSISNAGLPQGMVNRQGTPNFAKGYTQWTSLVSNILTQTPIAIAKLGIKTYYDTRSHYLSVNITTTFVAAWPNNVNLVVVLTQDSITACQRDNNASVAASDRDPDDKQIRLHYKFDHIVIGGMNSPQGQLIKATPSKGDTASAFLSCYNLNKCFVADPRPITFPPYTPICVNDKYVNVVAFIYDTTTMEVLQVETLPIFNAD